MISKIFFFQTATYSLLFYAHQVKNNFVFQLLVESGADLLWRNNRGSNILQLLAKVGNVECAKMCLEKLETTDPDSKQGFIENKNKNGMHKQTMLYYQTAEEEMMENSPRITTEIPMSGGMEPSGL